MPAGLLGAKGGAFGSIVDDDGPLPAVIIEDGETLETDTPLNPQPGGSLLAFTVRLTSLYGWLPLESANRR